MKLKVVQFTFLHPSFWTYMPLFGGKSGKTWLMSMSILAQCLDLCILFPRILLDLDLIRRRQTETIIFLENASAELWDVLTDNDMRSIPWEIGPSLCLPLEAGASAVVCGRIWHRCSVHFEIANTTGHALLWKGLGLKVNGKTKTKHECRH